MWIPGQPEVNRAFALLAAEKWDADPATIAHISDFGNSVYSFNRNGQKVILRLTDPVDRSQSVNQAELDFLLHLKQHGVQVNAPIRSQDNRLIETMVVDNVPLLASVLDYAPGVEVKPESPDWQEAFFRAWGGAMAHIHQAAQSFEATGENRRWQWMDENLIADARQLIPPDDTLSLRELDAVMEHLLSLPMSRETYGLIHADLGARNFHYTPQDGATVFDFGNCCYHWFTADVVIALSTLRHYPRGERDRYRAWMVAGYEEVLPLHLQESFGWFMRYRILYVYLDRLLLFNLIPNDDAPQILAKLRGQVHQTFEW